MAQVLSPLVRSIIFTLAVLQIVFRITHVVVIVIGMSQGQIEQIKQKLSHQLPQIKEHYHIIQLGIFGSYIRGEATNHSDLDILVEFDPEAKFGLLTFCELENYLSELLAIKVDLVDLLQNYFMVG